MLPPGAVTGVVSTAAEMHADDYQYGAAGSTVTFNKPSSVIEFFRTMHDAETDDASPLSPTEVANIHRVMAVVKDAAQRAHLDPKLGRMGNPAGQTPATFAKTLRYAMGRDEAIAFAQATAARTRDPYWTTVLGLLGGKPGPAPASRHLLDAGRPDLAGPAPRGSKTLSRRAPKGRKAGAPMPGLQRPPAATVRKRRTVGLDPWSAPPQLYDLAAAEALARLPVNQGGWNMTPAMRQQIEKAIRAKRRGLTRREIVTAVRRAVYAHESAGERRAYRDENPVSPKRFDRSHGLFEYEGSEMAGRVKEAEQIFGVIATGAIHGCGGNGCVFPTSDGNVLKITTDLSEERLVERVFKLRAFEGFATILKTPVRLSDKTLAYVREDVGMPHVSKDRAAVRLALDESGIERAFGKAVEYEQALARLQRIAKTVPPVKGIAITLQKLFDAGLLLGDLSTGNLGVREDGRVVIVDAQSFPVWRKPNPADLETFAYFGDYLHLATDLRKIVKGSSEKGWYAAVVGKDPEDGTQITVAQSDFQDVDKPKAARRATALLQEVKALRANPPERKDNPAKPKPDILVALARIELHGGGASPEGPHFGDFDATSPVLARVFDAGYAEQGERGRRSASITRVGKEKLRESDAYMAVWSALKDRHGIHSGPGAPHGAAIERLDREVLHVLAANRAHEFLPPRAARKRR